MLLVKPEDAFRVMVRYLRKGDGQIEILDSDKEGQEQEEFEFRRPTWQDARKILRLSARSPEDVDAMAFVEAKVTTLLKSWTLKDKEGRPLPLREVNSLPPSVVMYLNAQIDKILGPEGLMGTTGAAPSG